MRAGKHEAPFLVLQRHVSASFRLCEGQTEQTRVIFRFQREPRGLFNPDRNIDWLNSHDGAGGTVTLERQVK